MKHAKANARKKGSIKTLEEAGGPHRCPPVSSKRHNGQGVHDRTALRREFQKSLVMIHPDNLDRKSVAFQRYQQIVRNVTQDLGGAKRLSTIERTLVDAFGAVSVRVYDLAARQMLGERQSHLQDHKQLTNAI